MAADKKSIEEFIKPLRQKYLLHLKDWLATVEPLRVRLKNGQCSSKEMSVLNVKIHSLVGSGSTYGFDAISQASRELEIGLIGYQSFNTVEAVQLFDKLIDTCQQALENFSDEVTSVSIDPMDEKALSHRPILLIVDDDASVRDLLSELFKNDAEILTADNGRDALALIKNNNPDLVILDDKMFGGMSGMQVLEAVQGLPQLAHIPIIMLTANSKPLEVMRGAMFGAAEYLTKPFNPAEIAEKIRTRLARLNTKILIADDDLTIRELLGHKFRQAGVSVILAKNGEEALQLASTNPPHLVILDRMMPGLSGLGVLEKLRDISVLKDIPVLIITARDKDQDIKEGFRQGAVDYIIKPFSPEEVVLRCLKLLNITKQ